MYSVRLEPTKLIFVGTRATYKPRWTLSWETTLLPLDRHRQGKCLTGSLESRNPGTLRKNPVLPDMPENIVESSVFSCFPVILFFSAYVDTFPSPIYRKCI